MWIYRVHIVPTLIFIVNHVNDAERPLHVCGMHLDNILTFTKRVFDPLSYPHFQPPLSLDQRQFHGQLRANRRPFGLHAHDENFLIVAERNECSHVQLQKGNLFNGRMRIIQRFIGRAAGGHHTSAVGFLVQIAAGILV